LLIVHQPIDQANAGATVTINAMIKHNSGIQTGVVFWREVGATTFNQTSMTFVSNDNWTATISIPASGVDIEYYIRGVAVSGKALNRPIVAPNGYWTIDVQTLNATEWAFEHILGPYPNPTKDNVSFNLDQIGGTVNITISNVVGQTLFSQKLETGNGVVNLTLSPEWTGTLFINFEGDFGKVTKKVVKL
jgi:hypothetical protein